jgi:RND family efflux transporter MFP subunit
MKNTLSIVGFAALLVLASCGEQGDELSQKKSQLQEYKQEIKDLEAKVAELESEVASMDPDFASTEKNATLVTTIPVTNETFKHFVEVRGSVTSRRNVTVSAEAPAMVTQVVVDEGEEVRKGQVLVRQDAETLMRNIDEIKTSLELAETRFRRQTNLWDQNIGTEFQYLESKNAKESLDRRLASLQSQLNSYIIRAPFNGTIDEVFIKEGEMAQPGVPLLRLVSLSDMYIETDVSEAYLGEFEKGDSVEVSFPSLNKTINTVISAVGKVINENNRTYTVEVKLPGNEDFLRPNLMAVVKLKDFEQDDALIVPTNLILNDKKGDFIYVAVNNPDGEGLIAEKKHIQRGKTYNNMTMVESGLSGNEKVVDEGFRDVAEGVNLRVSENETESSVAANTVSAN